MWKHFGAEEWQRFDLDLNEFCRYHEVPIARYVTEGMEEHTNSATQLEYLKFGATISKEIWDAQWA